ncbi:MAG: 2-oxoglutarate dehydrogenase E1 component, partial [Planctomycetota bacterium]
PADSAPPPPQLTPANLAYAEAIYQQFLEDPDSVDPTWRQQFASWNGQSPTRIGPSFQPGSLFNPQGSVAPTRNGSSNGHANGSDPPAPAELPPRHGYGQTADHPDYVPSPLTSIELSESTSDAGAVDASALQHRVDLMIRNYRVRGHLVANLSPLDPPHELPIELTPGYYGFTDADMDKQFVLSSTLPGDTTRTLRDILEQLRNTYCQNLGVQFMHIDNLQVRRWLQRRMEETENTIKLSRKEQIRILTRLTDATIFEEFIQKKYIGAKSFSLEGAESLIPLLDLAFERAGDQGVQEIVVGMAHRGRLNVLANILGKSPQKIFREFDDADPEAQLGGGDVKYHLGYSSDWRTRSGKNIHLSLCFNPSHLEFVNPVVLGRMRAKQDRSGLGTRGERGMSLIIHGDAAFAGEGVVQETLNLAQLPGYTVGGTLHIVINNQIGFTTGPHDGRSTHYATDVAKMLQSPIIHVNGEAPEAVAQAVRLAMEFRREFKRDVVIDMYCYRRRGHNEGDEPAYTQPVMYRTIKNTPNIRKAYLDQLLKLDGVTQHDADRIAERRTELLEKELSAARDENYIPAQKKPRGLWAGYSGGPEPDPSTEPTTALPKQRIAKLLNKLTRTPDDFNLHPKLKKLFKLKTEMAAGDRPLDWAAAELLAFASLAVDGHRIRLTGQDCQRGTFSHRHAVLHDYQNGNAYSPLANLTEDQAPVDIFNSPLSEAGVLGFEYGFSLDYPCGLTLWEAQFGDFVNVAQPIIDQFIASAEDKWRRLSGLVMLLPHGFHGQGPEHSSARLERFLTQCAEDNLQVTFPTTPAQYFHLLRRQVLRKWRKPLIVMTPKGLLRHPRFISSLDDLAEGGFQRTLDHPDNNPKTAKRVLLCSGKVFYDLLEHREKNDRNDVAILRVEQLYPLPTEELIQRLEPYKGKPIFWVQEEPANQGAWPFILTQFVHHLNNTDDGFDVALVSRKPSASPATGSAGAHDIEEKQLLAKAFGDEI